MHFVANHRLWLEIRAATRFPWQGFGMFRLQTLAAALALLAASGCATSEPVESPSAAPGTSGGEVTTAPARRGNVASAQMAVEPRDPNRGADPSTVSSAPSALINQPQAQPVQTADNAAVVVTTPPPAPQPEAYPTQTSADWTWAPGYWYWYGGHYVWINGAWIPARRGHVYVSARWVQTGRGWMFVPGGWAVSTYDPIVYPVYPYDPFYYGPYWRDHPHHHYGYWQHHSRDRLRVRPDVGRRPERARPSSRLRVRAR